MRRRRSRERERNGKGRKSEAEDELGLEAHQEMDDGEDFRRSESDKRGETG